MTKYQTPQMDLAAVAFVYSILVVDQKPEQGERRGSDLFRNLLYMATKILRWQRIGVHACCHYGKPYICRVPL